MNFVLVGRPNVGKSTIFNLLVGKREAVVRDEEGTTVDWKEVKIGENAIWDTPGIWKIDSMPPCQIDQVLLVVENLVTESDKKIYFELKKKNYSLKVIVNKIDRGVEDYSFFQDYVEVSAKSKVGIQELKDFIASENLDVNKKEEKKLWAIIGRPNVGKSSLINFFSNCERNRVSEKEGTTREFIAVNLENDLLLDTPGQRKKAIFPKYDNIFGFIVVLDNDLQKQDLRLIDMAFKSRKAVMVVINKLDIVDRQDLKIIENEIKRLWVVPVLHVSCLKKKGLENLRNKMRDMEEDFYKRIATNALNIWLGKEIKRIIPRLKFISQISTAPARFFLDHKLKMHEERMLKKRIQKELGFEGIPICIKYNDEPDFRN